MNDLDLSPGRVVVNELQNLKKKFNITSKSLAKMSGVHERTLAHILAGNRSLTSDTSNRITENLASIFISWGEVLYRKNEKLNDLGVLVMALKKYTENDADGFVHKDRQNICLCAGDKKKVLQTVKLDNRVKRRKVQCLECNAKYNTFEIGAEDYFRSLVEHETLHNILNQFKNADIPYSYCLKNKADEIKPAPPTRSMQGRPAQVNKRPFSMKMGKHSY